MIKNAKKIVLIAGLFVFLFCGLQIKAISLNDLVTFNIDSNHSLDNSVKVQAKLVKMTSSILFYVDQKWWDDQTYYKKTDILNNLEILAVEFENKIYPNLTSIFGQEWKPGIDNEERITLLFHQMIPDSGGYFRSADEYMKAQATDSNEREMLYLPIEQIESNQLKVFLAHELMHLITFNQKEKVFDINEAVWLNESRAEYASNILGYDDNFEGSNLQRRVRAFLEKPSDSLTEWQDKKYDYGVANLFVNYLVDHYGIDILVNSLKSEYSGIESINYALEKAGLKVNFDEIFMDWSIAVMINDCSLGQNYCYLNKNLKNLKINPIINFLPLSGSSSLSVTNLAKNWSTSWQKIIGGNGDLKLSFEGLSGLDFRIPYIVYKKDGSYSIKFMVLDSKQKGEITILSFGGDVSSVIMILSLVSERINVNGFEPTYPYTLKISVTSKDIILSEDPVLIQKLLDQIDALKKEIAKILAQRGLGPITQNLACLQLTENLGFGSSGEQVRCLQGFLKNQGQEIYPEGFVTGNFGNLTLQAVKRFQEKYKSEILTPYGMQIGNGYVGPKTRIKINQLLGK